jgi:phosphoserine aminotransferase
MYRSHNFSAGPAALPLEVLKQAQEELLNFQDTGSSVMEISHRSPEYTAVHEQAKERLTRLLGLGDDFEIMFLQGGATQQFSMVPLNLSASGAPVVPGRTLIVYDSFFAISTASGALFA